MKVGHITGSVTQRGGGIPIALCSLMRAQVKDGVDVRLCGWDDGGEAIGDWPDGVLVTVPFSKQWGVPAGVGMTSVSREIGADLVHLHGLWTGASLSALQGGMPRVISPHGMLDGWALANSRWKKRLAGWWFENRNLHGAACLHALCEPEVAAMRAYGLKNPVCIIPNGIDLPDLSDNRPLTTDNGPKVLLFLGRIHPKKGLLNALRAWATVRGQGAGDRSQEDWRFVIAGWDQGGHEAELKRLCDELGVRYESIAAKEFLQRTTGMEQQTTVSFVGPAFGGSKDALLRQASAFILPSFSEGLPMSVLEAWSYRLPVLMTDHCNLPEGFAADAALRIGTDGESITDSLSSLFSAPNSSLTGMGDAGRSLVERQFTWSQVAAQMKDVYEWVLGGGKQPRCVKG